MNVYIDKNGSRRETEREGDRKSNVEFSLDYAWKLPMHATMAFVGVCECDDGVSVHGDIIKKIEMRK